MRTSLFLIYFLFAPTKAFGLGTNKCRLISLAIGDFFEKRHEELKASNLSPEEKKEIQKWFQNTKPGSAEENAASRKVFELLRKKLLGFYPKEIADEVFNFPNDYSYKEPDPNEAFEKINGVYTTSGITHIEIPERYRGTFLEFEIRTHEEYHQIEIKLLKKHPDFQAIKLDNKNPSPEEKEIRFLWEIGAIMREWQYLNAVPNEVRARWIETLKKDSKLSVFYRDSLIRRLQNASLAQEKYLEEEHKAGRYSAKYFNIEQKKAFSINKVISALTFAGGAGGVAAFKLLKKCNTLQKTSDELSASELLYYRKFCQDIGFSPIEE